MNNFTNEESFFKKSSFFEFSVKTDGFLARNNQYGYIDIKTHIAYANCDISDLSNRFALDKLKDGL